MSEAGGPSQHFVPSAHASHVSRLSNRRTDGNGGTHPSTRFLTQLVLSMRMLSLGRAGSLRHTSGRTGLPFYSASPLVCAHVRDRGTHKPALGSGQQDVLGDELECGHLVQSVLPGPFVLLDKVSGLRCVNTSMPALSPSSPVLVMLDSLSSAQVIRKGGGN